MRHTFLLIKVYLLLATFLGVSHGVAFENQKQDVGFSAINELVKVYTPQTFYEDNDHAIFSEFVFPSCATTQPYTLYPSLVSKPLVLVPHSRAPPISL